MISTQFFEIFQSYDTAIAASVIFSGALAAVGAHLSSREKSMQTLCVSQGAMLGVLIGLGLFGANDEEVHALSVLGPFISGAFAAVAAYAFSEHLGQRASSSKNAAFCALFAVLVALGHVVSALVPALENHMTQRFFGDLATLANHEVTITAGIGAGVLGIMLLVNRHFSSESFDTAILGGSSAMSTKRFSPMLFQFVALVSLCFSVQFLGFLFTVAALFIPTTIARLLSAPGIHRHFAETIVTATAGTLIGFLLSLVNTRLPTVPTIAVAMTLVGVIVAKGRLLSAN